MTMFPDGTFTEEHTTSDLLRNVADDLMKVRVSLAKRARQVGRRRSLASLLDEEMPELEYQEAVLRTEADFLDKSAEENAPPSPA